MKNKWQTHLYLNLEQCVLVVFETRSPDERMKYRLLTKKLHRLRKNHKESLLQFKHDAGYFLNEKSILQFSKIFNIHFEDLFNRIYLKNDQIKQIKLKIEDDFSPREEVVVLNDLLIYGSDQI